LNVEPELLAGQLPAKKPKRSDEVSSAVEDWSIAGTEALPVLSAWYYVPILELTTLEDYDGSAGQISQRLGLAPKITETALRELLGLGLLFRESGRYRKTEKKLRFTSSRPNPHIRKFHDEMLEKSQQALRQATSEADLERRLISGITVTARPERVQDAKRKLAECLHEIANDLAAEPGTEVYHLAVQLFPLTNK
jgi:uncharacterized protein (TIGR02147 family)